MSLNILFEILGAIVGIVFVYINIKASRSLTGSFFKKYYRWMTLGAIFLFLGFTTDVVGGWFGVSENITEVLHHVELLIFGVIFIFAARILPKEAAEHIKS